MPVAERPEIDRWILSNLQSLVTVANERFREFDTASVCRQAADFIDDLSNWYIRRNRRRFWRSRDAGDRDKLAAYQTLYHVLVELTKVLAPMIPFLTERMYANLVKSWRSRRAGERASLRLSSSRQQAARSGTQHANGRGPAAGAPGHISCAMTRTFACVSRWPSAALLVPTSASPIRSNVWRRSSRTNSTSSVSLAATTSTAS